MQDESSIIINPMMDINNEIYISNNKIHIRIKQRNRRKSTTYIENLSMELDLLTILSRMKKLFSCNGGVSMNEDGTKYMQLFGDQRANAKKFLIENAYVTESNIIIHGF